MSWKAGKLEGFPACGGKAQRSSAASERGLLEFSSIKLRLSDNRLKGTNPNGIVVGNWHGYGAQGKFFLHDNVASAAADLFKTVSRQN